jgi:probable 2-oxoglutarate dehydrogenase E1 component DHKTD1
MLVDQTTNEIYIPLNDMLPEQTGKLEMANSILSEEAVLGMSRRLSKELEIIRIKKGKIFSR